MGVRFVSIACVLWLSCGCAGRGETLPTKASESRKSATKRGAAGTDPANEAGAASTRDDRAAAGSGAGGPAGTERTDASARASSAGASGKPRGEAGAGTGGAGARAAGASGASGGPSAAGSELIDEECIRIDIRTKVVPTVWLLIDGSGSMVETLMYGTTPSDGGVPTPNVSRWDALRQTLLDPATGVLPKLAHDVKFGMVLYDGFLAGAPGLQTLPDGGPATGMPPLQTDACPRLTTVEPKLDNLDALTAAFPVLPPGGSTPTHKALAHLMSRQPSGSMVDPVYVVLATDGAPNDFCMEAMPFADAAGVQGQVVEQTQRLATQGTPMYVISLAASDPLLSAHLTQVAEAGGTDTGIFAPETTDRLVDSFRQILNPSVLCTLRLPTPRSFRNACQGRVQLNDQTLECDGPNGWKLRDTRTVELTGAACETYKAGGAHVEVLFPCFMDPS